MRGCGFFSLKTWSRLCERNVEIVEPGQFGQTVTISPVEM